MRFEVSGLKYEVRRLGKKSIVVVWLFLAILKCLNEARGLHGYTAIRKLISRQAETHATIGPLRKIESLEGCKFGRRQN